MLTYEFIKDYKNNDLYRLSFNNLAKETFGIDFETWYQQGHWNENYICYSFLKDDRVISNVSLNLMELMIEGKREKAIQIGTVMTDPTYRRQGLAQQLMNKVLEDFDQDYQLYFLAANEDAIPLYEKCDFILKDENQYTIDLTGFSRINEPLIPVELTAKSLLEIKKRSQPLSTVLSAIGDEHVLMFYYTLGFNHSIYQPQSDVTAIFEIEGETLHLYDILSPRRVDIQELIERITPIGVNTVCCHFTPDQPIKNLQSTIDSSSHWMLRTTANKTLPKFARFPKISQT
jgi:ribosomal protein S18 acetylase RimI-like enzyme